MSFAQDVSDLQTRITKGTALSKAAVKANMDAIAVRHRAAGESLSRAFTRLFVDDPGGRQVFKAFNRMVGPDHFAKVDADAPPVNYSGGPGGKGSSGDGRGNARDRNGKGNPDGDGEIPSFSQMVDDHQVANPKLPRSKSVSAVAATPEGARAITAERLQKMRRA